MRTCCKESIIKNGLNNFIAILSSVACYEVVETSLGDDCWVLGALPLYHDACSFFIADFSLTIGKFSILTPISSPVTKSHGSLRRPQPLWLSRRNSEVVGDVQSEATAREGAAEADHVFSHG